MMRMAVTIRRSRIILLYVHFFVKNDLTNISALGRHALCPVDVL